MTPLVKAAKYLEAYKIRISFEDGVEGDIDLEKELWGEVFEPLKDLAVFKTFQVNAELNTIVWPNGADFAPEYLYEQASA
jgi:Protein of unknown function (DUF2442)